MTDLVIRQATVADVEAMHALITAHLDEGHLLPRAIEELRRHAERFVVCELAGDIAACAELAPLSPRVAEVRSLVVSRQVRRVGLAARLIGELRSRGLRAGFDTLCAFTHDPRFFVRQNFSIVPHVWLPEKITRDCLGCPLFRACGQYAMVFPLSSVAKYAAPADRSAAQPVAVA